MAVDHHDLAGRHFAFEARADEIKSARFRRQHPTVAEAPENQRTEAVRIAHADESIGGEHDQRERAAETTQGSKGFTRRGLARQQMQDDLAVRRGLENGAGILEFFAQRGGIDEVAVVGDGQRPPHGVGDEGLRIRQSAGPGGRIADVTDGAVAFEPFERRRVEDLRYQAHSTMDVERMPEPLAGDDARALLSAVLQREEPVVGQQRRTLVAKDPEDSTFMAWVRGVVLQGGREVVSESI